MRCADILPVLDGLGRYRLGHLRRVEILERCFLLVLEDTVDVDGLAVKWMVLVVAKDFE